MLYFGKPTQRVVVGGFDEVQDDAHVDEMFASRVFPDDVVEHFGSSFQVFFQFVVQFHSSSFQVHFLVRQSFGRTAFFLLVIEFVFLDACGVGQYFATGHLAKGSGYV